MALASAVFANKDLVVKVVVEYFVTEREGSEWPKTFRSRFR